MSIALIMLAVYFLARCSLLRATLGCHYHVRVVPGLELAISNTVVTEVRFRSNV